MLSEGVNLSQYRLFVSLSEVIGQKPPSFLSILWNFVYLCPTENHEKQTRHAICYTRFRPILRRARLGFGPRPDSTPRLGESAGHSHQQTALPRHSATALAREGMQGNHLARRTMAFPLVTVPRGTPFRLLAHGLRCQPVGQHRGAGQLADAELRQAHLHQLPIPIPAQPAQRVRRTATRLVRLRPSKSRRVVRYLY